MAGGIGKRKAEIGLFERQKGQTKSETSVDKKKEKTKHKIVGQF